MWEDTWGNTGYFPWFGPSIDYNSFLCQMGNMGRAMHQFSALVGMWRPFVSSLGKGGLRYFTFCLVSLGWNPDSHPVWMCMSMHFPFCPDLFIKRKTHLHKKASELSKNVHFVFLSAAPRHVGFELPLRGFWRLAFISNKAFSHWKDGPFLVWKCIYVMCK